MAQPVGAAKRIAVTPEKLGWPSTISASIPQKKFCRLDHLSTLFSATDTTNTALKRRALDFNSGGDSIASKTRETHPVGEMQTEYG